MANGHYKNRTPHRVRNCKRKLALLLSLILLMGTAIGGTLAYLISDSSQVTNSFIAGNVACTVIYDDENENYNIQNTGNIPAYIRAVVVANWVGKANTEQAGMIYAQGPNIKIDEKAYSGDVIYFPNKVPVGSSVTLKVSLDGTCPSGYSPQIQILAEAIQTEPADQVTWGKAGMKQGG